MTVRIMIILTPHYGKIVEDCDGLLNPGDRENAHAYKYIRRVTDKRNLKQAMSCLQLVEEVQEGHACNT